MSLNNPATADWSRPGAIGSVAPSSAQFNALTVDNAQNIIATFSSSAQYYGRLKVQHNSSSGIALFNGNTWTWSLFSDSVLLNGTNSLIFVNEYTGKMCFAVDGNVSKTQIFGGFRVDLETPALTFSSPSSPGPGCAAIAKDLSVGGTFQLGQFTVATVPTAYPAGKLIWVSNATGGATISYSDGSYWRRSDNQQILS